MPHATIRAKLADGRLPLPEQPPGKVWVGHGNGRDCDGCDTVVTSVDIEYEVDISDGRAVEEGVGVSLVPASLVEPGAERRRRYVGLRGLRVSDARLRHTVSVVCHGERAGFPLTREFLAIMRALQKSLRR
jgi:hypothetical protein